MAYEQSFAWWSFTEGIDASPQLLDEAAAIGYRGVDFLPRGLWPRARDLGLELVIIDGHETVEVGFNDRANHRDLSDQLRRNLALAVDNDVRFLSVASGDRTETSAEDGLAACAEALIPLAEEAEAAGVGLLIEPLNTKVDHPGHECDTTRWGVELIEAVGSPALRLCYDGYHAQIMEGDLIRTMDAHLPLIAHIHTAGVPGRHELDDEQEVNWRGIARWLHRSAFDGYVAHELIPRGDPVVALRGAFALFEPARSAGGTRDPVDSPAAPRE